MRWDALNDKCIYALMPEMEPLYGVLSLLYGEKTHQICMQIYGKKRIASWKRRYRFLFETFDSVKSIAPTLFLDIMLDLCEESFTAERLMAHILSLPEDERLYRQGEWEYVCGAGLEDLRNALTDDVALEALYAKAEETCLSFLGFSSFVRQNDRVIREFFSFASELDSPELQQALTAQENAMERFRSELLQSLKSADGLECSQALMGKTFRNRGPYERFYFAPSLLLPYRSCRLFYDNGKAHNRQLLIHSIREAEKTPQSMVAGLKAMADETRYQILMLLAKRGPINGQEIARALKLAPSTVSHHMNELKNCGLITEEAVKTAKHYGLAHNAVKSLLESIENDLNIHDAE